MIGIKRFKYGYRSDGYGQRFLGLIPDAAGSVVLHTDHLASHAFDEAVEQAAFEADFNVLELQGGLNSWTGRWEYDHPHVNSLWQGWLRCTKSRAKRFGGAE